MPTSIKVADTSLCLENRNLTAPALILEIEEVASNAWPARDMEQLGGWKLRANDGITRRANSVLPLDDPGIDLDDAIDYAEFFYERRGLQAKFQMTEASLPEELDDRLARLGYAAELRVHAQVATARRLVAVERPWTVHLSPVLTKDWLTAYAAAGGYEDMVLQVRKGILERIQPDHVFALAVVDGQTAGVGLGVVEQGWLGLFGVETLSQYRRRGVATSLCQSLVSWAMGMGATRVYLQVEEKNTPALALYKKMGLRTVYTYWCRVRGQ